MMGPRLKFNLVLLLVFILGLTCAWSVARELFAQSARSHVLRHAGLILESAMAVRNSTMDQIRARIDSLYVDEGFSLSSVPDSAVTDTVAQLRQTYPDYTYREAALNPMNPRNRVTDWEADVVQAFRNHPETKELVGERTTPLGPSLFLARPIQVKTDACSYCHDLPEKAPPALVKRYGSVNGYGWKLNEIVGAQIVSVPMAVPFKEAEQVVRPLMGALIAVFVLLFLLINLSWSLGILQAPTRAQTEDRVGADQAAARRPPAETPTVKLPTVETGARPATQPAAPAAEGTPAQAMAAQALPNGCALLEYKIESVLGRGAFGITYRAQDTNLDCKVSIKEFFPSGIAARTPDLIVMPDPANAAESFRASMARFLGEARILAALSHPNIVRVLRFFERHNTAYMVMEYLEGMSLGQWRRQRPRFDREILLGLMKPLLSGLEAVHAEGILHRDIKPTNIFIRTDTRPVLLDFGSACTLKTEHGALLTPILTPGFAPIEQYYADGKLGPWSDIYALGAVLYLLVAGVMPPEAPARVKSDPLKPATEAADGSLYGKAMLEAIDWALQPDRERRPQSIAEFRRVLCGDASPHYS